jgi:hypothetical protein
LATCLLTAAEQSVVNRALAVVIQSVPDRLLAGIERQMAKVVQRQQDVPSQIAAVKLLSRLASLQAPLQDAWARLMTDQLLVIVLPTEMLRLGRDVPLPNAVAPMFPSPLRNLQIQATVLDDYRAERDFFEIKKKLTILQSFVASLDRSNSGRGSAARDWRRFDDRMNWAISLFRSRQPDPTLFWPPYSVEDTIRIREGKLPNATGHPGQAGVNPPLDPDSISKFLNGAV